MSSVEVKRVTGRDYFEHARQVANYAFGATPAVPDTSKDDEMLPYMEQVRAYVTYVDGKPQATATLFPMTQQVRGNILTMSGVGGVATMPSARRQGLIRSLFTTMYDSMREHGEAITTLYPFRESF